MKLLNFKRNTIGDYKYRHGLFVPVENFFVDSPLLPDQIFEYIAEDVRTLHSALHWELYCMAPL